MNTFSILTAQIGMFVIYMLAGVILIRTRVMNRENLEVISKICNKTGASCNDFYQYCKRSGT